ncbi:hypothetical protein StoSoilB3_14040 [Arthrobacter sp. StoSoilB3]|nr:hypothetical protein StoSoilB3_14040 [Arthrobacter sp. StoSoilB3]
MRKRLGGDRGATVDDDPNARTAVDVACPGSTNYQRSLTKQAFKPQRSLT